MPTLSSLAPPQVVIIKVIAICGATSNKVGSITDDNQFSMSSLYTYLVTHAHSIPFKIGLPVVPWSKQVLRLVLQGKMELLVHYMYLEHVDSMTNHDKIVIQVSRNW